MIKQRPMSEREVFDLRSLRSRDVATILIGIPASINEMAEFIHRQNAQWWHDIETGEPITLNVGEQLMLCVSELSEAMEGHRKSLMDDKLQSYKMLDVELADCVIRILDLAAGLNIDIGSAIADKIAYNSSREDHKREYRLGENGKKY